MQPTREHWEERYTAPHLPWDSGITPPEIVDFWESARIPIHKRAGAIALDLGCGTGTNVAYLACLGLSAIGVEWAGRGLVTANERLHQRHHALVNRIHLVQGSVTQLPFTGLNASYIMDVGCFHAIHPDERANYAAGVIDNLAVGGYYQLYAFDWMEERARAPDKSPRGMRETEVADLFAPALMIVDVLRATPNPHPCRWYLLQKSA